MEMSDGTRLVGLWVPPADQPIYLPMTPEQEERCRKNTGGLFRIAATTR